MQITLAEANQLHYRRCIARRSSWCAIASLVAGGLLFAPWHGGRPAHSGYADLGVWPAVLLWIVTGSALLAAVTTNRRLQRATGVAAIVVPIIAGITAIVLSRIGHVLTDVETAGGDIAFIVLVLATAATGIVNVADPWLVAAPAPLPHARLRQRRAGH